MKKILLSLLVLLIFCGAGIAAQEKPLHLWVPYDPEKPDELKQLEDKYIFIQDTDLEEIKNSQNPQNTDPGDPPLSYQVTSVNYSAKIIDDIAKITGVYKINKLDDKWALVPILSAQANVKQAELNGATASITKHTGTYHALPLKDKGSYVLKLQFEEKINKAETQNTSSFEFSQPIIPVTNLECWVNRHDMAFDVTNSVSVTTTKTENGTKAVATLPPTGHIQALWTPKNTLINNIKQNVNLPPSANAVTYTKLEAGRGALKGIFTAELDIRRSPLSYFEFYIPDGIEIDTIEVRDNELIDPYPEIKDNIMPVELTSAIEGKINITINFRQNFDDSSFKTKLPTITLVNDKIDRETGFVALVETTNIESSIIEADETKNYREIDSNELEGVLRGLKSSIALKYTKDKENISEIPYDITIDIVRHKDVAVYEANIESTEVTSVINKNGGMLTKAVLRVKNTAKQFLEITLPKDSTLWSVYVNNKSVKPALKDAKKNLYAIPLVTAKSFPVEIVYFTEKVTSPLWIDMKALKTELVSNSVKWNIYIPKDKSFIPIDASSNLLKDKKVRTCTGCDIYQNTSRFDQIMTMPSEECAQIPCSPAVKNELKSYGSSVMQKSIAPQRIYKSKKVGKLPVYVNLPLIGKEHKFYQITFEGGIFPAVGALYLNCLILDILKLLIITGILYTLFKNDRIRHLWLPKAIGAYNTVREKMPKPSKSVIKNLIIFGAVILFITIGFIWFPPVILLLILLSIAVLALAGVVFLVRFLIRKWRNRNENK